MDKVALAKRLLRLAKHVMADKFDDFWREYDSGGWEYGAFFPGKTRPGREPKSSGPMKHMHLEDFKKVVTEMISFEQKRDPESLILTFKGNAGRTDTYVWTKVPYEEAFAEAGARAPKKKVWQLVVQVMEQLRQRGLRSLGTRYGKAGDQWGISERDARRVAVGARDLLFNRFQVVIHGADDLRRPDESWTMAKSYLLSEVDDKILDEAADWVKRASTMADVRDMARDEFQETGKLVVRFG